MNWTSSHTYSTQIPLPFISLPTFFCLLVSVLLSTIHPLRRGICAPLRMVELRGERESEDSYLESFSNEFSRFPSQSLKWLNVKGEVEKDSSPGDSSDSRFFLMSITYVTLAFHSPLPFFPLSLHPPTLPKVQDKTHKDKHADIPPHHHWKTSCF